MAGTILAMRLGPDYVPSPFLPQETGWKAVLAVQYIVARVQTTVFYGNNLYQVGRLSALDEVAIFSNLIKPYSGRAVQWGQLDQVPLPPYPAPLWRVGLYPPPLIPVATGSMVALSSGFDSLRGYWVEFEGNYFLTCQIFKDWTSRVIRDIPDHR